MRSPRREPDALRKLRQFNNDQEREKKSSILLQAVLKLRLEKIVK
jgi:hypothetical protein